MYFNIVSVLAADRLGVQMLRRSSLQSALSDVSYALLPAADRIMAPSRISKNKDEVIAQHHICFLLLGTPHFLCSHPLRRAGRM